MAFRVRYGIGRTQPAPLLDAAEFSDTRSKHVEASKHTKFTSFTEFGHCVSDNTSS